MATKFRDASDFTGRALLVQGISSVLSQCQNADKIIIHFQRKINRGGDVTKVLYPLDSNRDAAIVVFYDAKDRESTLLHRHVFHDVTLKVQRLPPIFRSVEVEIDPVYATLLPDVVHDLMRSQGSLRSSRFGTQNTHKLSFSCPSELRYAEEKVYDYMARQSQTAHFFSAAAGSSYHEQVELTVQAGKTCGDEVLIDKERNKYQPEETEPEVFIDQRKTEIDYSATHAAEDKKIEGNETSCTDAQVRGPPEQTSDSSIQMDNSVVLDMFSYNFLMQHEKTAVEKILKNRNVGVRITENDMDLSVRATFAPSKTPKGSTQKEEIQKAIEEFTILFQTTSGRLSRKTVECPTSISTYDLEKAALNTSKAFKSKALITKVDQNPIYYVILSSNDAEEVAQHFRKGAGIQPKKKLRNANLSPGPENKETVPEQTTGESVATNQSMNFNGSIGQNKTDSLGGRSTLHSSQTASDIFATNEGMTIFIRKGDITRQHEVHAIVNPTDCYLRNLTGASKAIGTAAGPNLKKWCDQYNFHNRWDRKLLDSECCVSPGFDLRCRLIIHIGPMTVPYNKQNMMQVLYQTFLNCLQTAHKNKVKSLAMPLLGSGGTRAPKEACADALAQALIDFSSCEPSRILSEVYLVNIDSEANRALKHSLESAFKETKRTMSGDHCSSTPSVNIGRSAEMSPHGKSSYDTKDQLQRYSGQSPTEPNLPIKHPNADQGYKSTTEKGQSNMKTSFGAGPITEMNPVDSNNATSEECPICLLGISDVQILKCGHRFCRKCIHDCLKQSHLCPVCRAVCAQPKGKQPKGTMKSVTDTYFHLPGYALAGTITIYYNIPSGVQSECHPHPGKHFSGVSRTAYLPDNVEGREVLYLLKKAFDACLVFTVGHSITSGFDDTVTWNDIHHKTSRTGGPSNYGYPDPGYLARVKEDLAAIGIK